MSALTPSLQGKFVADFGAELDELANCIKKQIGIGRKMNLCFDCKGITAALIIVPATPYAASGIR